MAYKPLHLLALDEADLGIVSAAAQDAIFQVADAVWLPSSRRFSLKIQRYIWEDDGTHPKGARVWAVLAFEGVLAVRAQKVAQSLRDAFGSVLSVSFQASDKPEDPGGIVTLNLADHGAIALEVECLDTVLADIGAPREAVARPQH